MKLALIQMGSAIGGLDENVARASHFIDEAAGQGAQLLVLPEFWSTGYFPLSVDYSFYDLADGEAGKATTAARQKAREHRVHIASTIYERQSAGFFYNTSMMIDPGGEIISKYRKVHVPARRALEKLFYRGGSKFPVARVGDWQVGTMLCYDTLLPEPARCLTLNGAELILAPFGASTTEEVSGSILSSPGPSRMGPTWLPVTPWATCTFPTGSPLHWVARASLWIPKAASWPKPKQPVRRSYTQIWSWVGSTKFATGTSCCAIAGPTPMRRSQQPRRTSEPS